MNRNTQLNLVRLEIVGEIKVANFWARDGIILGIPYPSVRSFMDLRLMIATIVMNDPSDNNKHPRRVEDLLVVMSRTVATAQLLCILWYESQDTYMVCMVHPGHSHPLRGIS